MRRCLDLRRSGVGRIDTGADGFKGITDVVIGNDGMNTLTDTNLRRS